MLRHDRQQKDDRPFRPIKEALAATAEGRDVLRSLGYQIVMDTQTLTEKLTHVRA